MDCNNNWESAGCSQPCSLPQINQGTSSSEQKVLTVTLIDRATGKPVDLSTATAIVANFPATNTPGFISKSLGSGIAVVSPGQLGQAQITLAGSDVALLTPGIISFTVYVTNATITNGIAQFLNAIQVNQPPFPGA